jgi:hypothetical protein
VCILHYGVKMKATKCSMCDTETGIVWQNNEGRAYCMECAEVRLAELEKEREISKL